MPVLSSYPNRVLTKIVGLDSLNRVGLSTGLSTSAWADVKTYGAVGDGSANDAAAIQLAIDAVDAQGGGIVFFPRGGYKVLSSLHVNGAGTRLVGPGGNAGTSVIYTNDTDINAIVLHGFSNTIENLIIEGGGVSSTNATIRTTDDAVECQFVNLRVTGGAQCIDITTPDCIIYGGHWESSYGNAIIQVRNTSGIYIIRVKADQNFPGTTPTTTPVARANTTAYSTNDVVSFGAYYIQCTQAGTSAGIAPTLQNYGVNITDGTVIWQLVGATDYASLKLDSCFSCFAYGCDHTGPFSSGILFSDDNTVGGPQSCVITDATVANCWTAGISIDTGAGNQIKGGIISGGIDSSAGIVLGGDGDNYAIGVLIISWDIGIFIDDGATNNEAAHNMIFSCGVGILANDAATKFSIADNKCGSSNTWGVNANGIVIGTGCDVYNIVNNIYNGASTGLSNSSSGAATKTISGNI